MTTIKEAADREKVKVAEVKKLLRGEFPDEDFSSPDFTLSALHLQRIDQLLRLKLAEWRRRPADVVAAIAEHPMPEAVERLPPVAVGAAGVPRPGGEHRLIVHQDVLDYLARQEGEHRRIQSAVQRIMREMLVVGRAQRSVKGTRGVNNGWLRAPLGDNGGSHYYLWHALAGTKRTSALGLRRGDVVVRAVRHHDETNDSLDAGGPDDYLELDASGYIETIETGGADVLSLPQREACAAAAMVSITKGHPGAGKTTLQLERTRRHHGRLLFMTFGDAQRAHAERWLATYADPRQTWLTLTHREFFQALDPAWRLLPAHDEAVALLASATLAESRALGPWRDHVAALYAELRAYYWGRAIPYAFRDVEAATDDASMAAAYRARRGAALAPAALEAAIHVAQALPAEVRARLFGDLDRVRALATQLGTGGGDPLPDALAGLEAVLVDEVQDLTLVEMLVIVLVARRVAESSGRKPAFHVAGDEGQTVRPTEFDWGEAKSLLDELLGRPGDFELPGNVRSPQTITRIVNNSWKLYKSVDKRTRPRGVAAAHVEETAIGTVLWVDAADEDLARLCAIVASTPGGALVYPGPAVPEDVRAAAATVPGVRVLAAPEAKGLDFRVAFVLDVGRRAHALYQVVLEGDTKEICTLENRVAVDQIRVAISRATEVLVFVERPMTRDARARLEMLCSDGPLLDGVVADVALDELERYLDVDTSDRIELVTEALAEVDRVLEDDPAAALRIAGRARGWLGDSNRAGAVQGALRKQVYRAHGQSLLRMAIASEVEREARFTRANAELRLADAADLARFALEARAVLTGEDNPRKAVAALAKLALDAAPLRRDALAVLHEFLAAAATRSAGYELKEWSALVDCLGAMADVAAVNDRIASAVRERAIAACEWALSAPAGKSSMALAEAAVKLIAPPVPLLDARVAERARRYGDAIALYRQAGALADALRVSRGHGDDVELSLALATSLADPGTATLERLARIRRELLALDPDELTPSERAALTQLVKTRIPGR